MRKSVLAATVLGLMAAMSLSARAMPISAPAVLKSASDQIQLAETVHCGYYGCGYYRPYYRPYYGYYRPYYRPYYGYRYYRPYYRPYYSYGYYRPYYRPYYGYGYSYYRPVSWWVSGPY